MPENAAPTQSSPGRPKTPATTASGRRGRATPAQSWLTLAVHGRLMPYIRFG